MIAVIGGSGTTGGAVVRHLARRGAAIRALARSEESAARLRSGGASEAVVGDFRVADDLQRLLEGAESLFHVAPPFMEDEAEIGRLVVTKAKAAGLRHIVFGSVFHPQIRKMEHHVRKLWVEEAVIESGLAFNIVQPAMLMQNLRAVLPAVAGEGAYPVFFSPSQRFAFVDVEDLGEAVAVLLMEPGHLGAIVEAVGQASLDFDGVATILGEALGRPVHARPAGLQAARQFAAAQGWTPYAVQAFQAMCEYYDGHGLPGGNPAALAAVLKRQPTDYRAFAKRFLLECAGVGAASPPRLPKD